MSKSDFPPSQRSLSEDRIGQTNSRFEEGMKIDRFVVLQPMGSGGMGDVYAAWDPHLGRRVAIKVLHPSTATDSAQRARMLREARALAQLSHPNVVRVYEIGETAGFPFLVMELVDGESLDHLIRAGRLPQKEMARLFLQAADGLKAVHALGIVHRDVKPNNILVGKDGRVCVGDFGLAVSGDRLSGDAARAQHFEADWHDDLETGSALREVSADDISLSMTLTQMGSLLGTPAFMSPEQLNGEPVDERSDQYSFAVSMWRGLFGADPFPATKSLVKRLERMRLRPDRPNASSDDLHVAPILERALRFAPEERHPDMAAFQSELFRCLQEADTSRFSLLQKPKYAIGVGVGFALALCVGAFGLVQIAEHNADACNPEIRVQGFRSKSAQQALRATLLQSKQIDPKRMDLFLATVDAYAARWQSAAESVCRAPATAPPAVRACLEARLGDLGALVSLVGNDAPRVFTELHAAALSLAPPDACFQEASDTNEMGLPTDALLGIRSKLARARALSLSGVAREAMTQAEEATNAARQIGADHEAAEGALIRGQAAASAGRFDESATWLRESIATALTIRAERIEAAAWAELLSVVGDKQGNFEEGLRILPMVRAAAQRVSYENNVLSAARLAEALLWKGLQQPAKAEQAAREALHAAEQRKPHDARLRGRILCILGLILGDQGRVHEGIELIQNARVATLEALPENHLHIAIIDNNLGVLQLQVEAYEEATIALERTYNVLHAQADERQHVLAAPLNNLGRIARQQGNFELARAHFENAHRLLQSSLGDAHRRTAISLTGLARLAQDEGDYGKADRLFETILRNLNRAPEESEAREATRVERAVLALESGDLRQAEKHLDEVAAFLTQRNDAHRLRAEWALAKMTWAVLLRRWDLAKSLWALANDGKSHADDAAFREALGLAEHIFLKQANNYIPASGPERCTGKRRHAPLVRLLAQQCNR